MPERSTEALLQELCQDLTPVRPLGSLRVTACVLAGVFALALAASGMLGLPLPGLTSGVPWRSAAFLALLLGLGLLAAGGLTVALAGAIPGRDALECVGRRMAWAGLGVCIATSLGWCLSPGALGGGEVPLAASLNCLARAAGLALPPALAAGVFLARAYECRRLMGGVWACVGAVALGAWAVHASCSAGDAAHVVLGHVLEPLAVAALVGALIAPWLRRDPVREGAV
ncbi:MAG: hypothetical protein JRH16_15650 [Deltaproteobacteria bacterium]|nr:hypothetical protein [Deltaproteobacteria bacterium]MBW2360656.1 hypothetical protein [Deltaproteobacteria bacterium]